MPQRWRLLISLLSCGALLVVTAPRARSQAALASAHLGRAVVEFNDAAIQMVASYAYSQRNHDSRWLMFEVGLSTAKDSTIQRTAIALRSPNGGEVPLATQGQVNEDINGVKRLLQDSSAVRHDVPSYFTQRDRVEHMRLFTLPFGPVVFDSFVVDRDRVAVGLFLFESPSGAWDKGTYALILRHAEGAAELPIRLE
jgi:hypothetical protein